MNTVNSVKRRLVAARATLVLDHPFFGALALRMDIQEETRGRTRTMATDGRSVFYQKNYVEGCSDQELVGLLAHEVMHPAMQHHTRRGDRDPGLWNEAADYAINPILTDAGFVLPGAPLLNREYGGMTAEQIYEALKKSPDDEDSAAPDDPESDHTGDGDSRAEGGDGGDGAPDDGEDDNSHAIEQPGGVLDAPDPAQQEAEWQVALKQATQAAHMMGQLPGGIALAVEEILRHRVDWKSILRRFVQQSATADYSWRMPNRRYIAAGLYLPDLRSESLPSIVVVVDSSASTRAVLPAFKAELQSIVEECQPESTIVVMADAKVQRVDEFQRGEAVQFNVEGFGGTDFRPAFEHVDQKQLNPACLIYLTDADGVYPDEPSPYSTLWAITTPNRQAPWGETVYIDVTGS
jgi:predicted metal-dependent peptidase